MSARRHAGRAKPAVGRIIGYAADRPAAAAVGRRISYAESPQSGGAEAGRSVAVSVTSGVHKYLDVHFGAETSRGTVNLVLALNADSEREGATETFVLSAVRRLRVPRRDSGERSRSDRRYRDEKGGVEGGGGPSPGSIAMEPVYQFAIEGILRMDPEGFVDPGFEAVGHLEYQAFVSIQGDTGDVYQVSPGQLDGDFVHSFYRLAAVRLGASFVAISCAAGLFDESASLLDDTRVTVDGQQLPLLKVLDDLGRGDLDPAAAAEMQGGGVDPRYVVSPPGDVDWGEDETQLELVEGGPGDADWEDETQLELVEDPDAAAEMQGGGVDPRAPRARRPLRPPSSGGSSPSPKLRFEVGGVARLG